MWGSEGSPDCSGRQERLAQSGGLGVRKVPRRMKSQSLRRGGNRAAAAGWGLHGVWGPHGPSLWPLPAPPRTSSVSQELLRCLSTVTSKNVKEKPDYYASEFYFNSGSLSRPLATSGAFWSSFTLAILKSEGQLAYLIVPETFETNTRFARENQIYDLNSNLLIFLGFNFPICA